MMLEGSVTLVISPKEFPNTDSPIDVIPSEITMLLIPAFSNKSEKL